MLRAMIVDDEAPARSELRFLLEQTGKMGAITEAASVRTAIEMLMENRVDVVFLDISMPGASGIQLAEALHKLKNPPAIVFVTAYSDHAVEAFDVDAVDDVVLDTCELFDEVGPLLEFDAVHEFLVTDDATALSDLFDFVSGPEVDARSEVFDLGSAGHCWRLSRTHACVGGGMDPSRRY